MSQHTDGPLIGELCAGYNGLGMAVEAVFGGRPAWFSEFDAAPSKILAYHYPDVPNYGDMTKIDWAAIQLVDIISGGTPCQDLSAAGARRGMTEGTRSNLWVQMREAIAIQQPEWVVWENVRGAYSATAASDLEQCPGCMGDTGDGGTVLRALGRVLGDLSDLGYDAEWRGLRASDVGACHARFRVFVLARRRATTNGHNVGDHRPRQRAEQDGRREFTDGGHATPDADDAGRSEQRRTEPVRPEHPATEHQGINAANPKGEHSIERRVAAPGQAQGREPFSVNSRCGGTGINADAQRLRLAEGRQSTPGQEENPGRTPAVNRRRGGTSTNWGAFEPAVRRWERVNGPAPRPTEPTGRNGAERLSPRFTEWMMGLPDGWVTAPEIGISRNDQIKACGNGVVPQQAIAAIADMLAVFQMEEEEAA